MEEQGESNPMHGEDSPRKATISELEQLITDHPDEPIQIKPDGTIERDTDYACFVKAKDKGEATFSLRAQDITAPILVWAWVMLQLHIHIDLANGFTVETAIERLTVLLHQALVFPDGVEAAQIAEQPKLVQALAIMERMQAWPARKIAD